MKRRAAAAVLLFPFAAGCARTTLPHCDPAADGAANLFVIDHGWHTDLAISADALSGPLASFRSVFPGMRVLQVGFGRRTFMTAPVTGLSDLLIGPFPGDGTLLVAGLTAPPDRAYADGRMARFHVDPADARRLSDFVWNGFRLDAGGRPVRIADGFFPGSQFYATRIGYSGLYTCNSWSEDALHQAGLAPAAGLTILSSQVMAHVRPLCEIGPH
ncbi:DUF2459 domain-containing protein [Acetobacteraceae bacterium KSS8]|uniref:DUF2459 domain-containing protein n=1 Tax=Endosaccharibacter trunci TaxID=2812733 RepID=A0ABT1W3J0_9PROT|nr:DUF2459 domain-containing protein [Acetobacteraceae bacterium KSS8]